MTSPQTQGFTPGVEFNQGFYLDAIAPLLGDRPHSAGLLGWGSDVLGYDSLRSTDHGWGPRLVVLVPPDDVPAVRSLLEAPPPNGLPETYRGWPVRYGWDEVGVSQHVTVAAPGDWLREHLGVDASGELSPLDWLLMPQQLLLGVVRGGVYHDGLGVLGTLRRRLEWYPHEVWLWLMACQWHRISQEEAFVGRTVEAGDHLGSAVLIARLTREIMRLALLQRREYAPYSKWLGTAFARLPDDDALGVALRRAVGTAHPPGTGSAAAAAFAAGDHRARERALLRGYELIARRHNGLGVTEPVDPTVRRFHNRPYQVLDADRFTRACLGQVTDRTLVDLPLIGSIDQVVDTTDVLSTAERCQRLRALYTG